LEKARGFVRALHLTELEHAGRARAAALEQADIELQRIAARLADALEAGISLSEIARVTGVSRPTLYELRTRRSDLPRDLTLALLQLIGTRGAVPVSTLSAEMGRPGAEYSAVLDSLISDGFIEYEVEEGPDGPEGLYVLTGKGHDLLENWQFISDEEGREA
jgi:transcriptional regulator with XRE-family HTH domain